MTTLASRAQLRASFIRWALFCVPAIVLLGFLSGQLAGTGEGDPWFAALAKPDFYPDASLFPIVWGILYVMMGLALRWSAPLGARRAGASRSPPSSCNSRSTSHGPRCSSASTRSPMR